MTGRKSYSSSALGGFFVLGVYNIFALLISYLFGFSFVGLWINDLPHRSIVNSIFGLIVIFGLMSGAEAFLLNNLLKLVKVFFNDTALVYFLKLFIVVGLLVSVLFFLFLVIYSANTAPWTPYWIWSLLVSFIISVVMVFYTKNTLSKH